MFGAICGDVLGAPYEIYTVKFIDFELLSDNSRYTDDTVCTFAISQAILDGSLDFDGSLRGWCRAVPVKYGNSFDEWLHSPGRINNSAGNGAVMRVSAIPWLAPDLKTTIEWAAKATIGSHRHPDAVAGAISVVVAARLGLEGYAKEEAINFAAKLVGYDICQKLDDVREDYGFRLLTIETAPIALRAVLEGNNFEEVLRLAISMGGDADTLAATAGGIAEVYYPIPKEIREHVSKRLPKQVLAACKEVRHRYRNSNYTKTMNAMEVALMESEYWINKSRSTVRKNDIYGALNALKSFLKIGC